MRVERLYLTPLAALVWLAGCAPAAPPSPTTVAPSVTVVAPAAAASPAASVAPAASPSPAPAASSPSVAPSPSPVVAGGAVVVTDMAGRSVSIPAQVNRIAEEWSAHAIILEMLGVGDKLVAVNQGVLPPAMPFLQQVDPHLASLSGSFTNTSVNHEDLLSTRPDVVFAATNSPTADSVATQDGLPVVKLGFNTFPEMKTAIEISGQVLRGNAPARAASFNTYLDAKLAQVQSRTAGLAAGDRPSVLHVVDVTADGGSLRVDGGNTLIDTWIILAGGTNAARDVVGAGGNNNAVTVNVEQLAAWDPDVIILQAPSRSIAEVTARPVWGTLKAVTSRRVYLNPRGVFPWDRYGPEAALQVQWAGQTLHPDLFTDLDMRAETQSFYKTFLGYTTSEADLNTIFSVTP